MSDPILAVKDPAVVLSDALAIYKAQTGVTLAPADPRRLHLQTLLYLLAQQRQLIDYSGKQSMLQFVDAGMPIASAVWIKALAALWEEAPIPAGPSLCTLRFTFTASGSHTIGAGIRATDGTNTWAVSSTAVESGTYVDALAACAVPGSASNGIAAGQIATLVDPITGCSSVENLNTTFNGRDVEDTESFRARLRNVPESRSTCGPRVAYQQGALAASAQVIDCAALGPDDAVEMSGTPPAPGEIHVLIIQGTRDANGAVTSSIPDPDGSHITLVSDALSAEDVRPLGDYVIVKAPQYLDTDALATYYIARSRMALATQIEAACEAAFAAYCLWQTSAIGRDPNPSKLIADLVNAGAKRAVVSSPSWSASHRDVVVRLHYETLSFGGVEDD